MCSIQINRTQVVRLLKLLRYFESLRLLVDAAANSVEALPVLFYTLALGFGFSSLCCSSLSKADVRFLIAHSGRLFCRRRANAQKTVAAALPLLSWSSRCEAAEVLITLSSATIIYLVEVRSNIPSLAHAIWLAIVTMTTVGDVL